MENVTYRCRGGAESWDESRAREHTRTYAMAAMTGAGFRRRDACRAHGPEVSTTAGASGWSAEIKWRGGRRGRDGEWAGDGGKGIALGTTPNPQRSRTPSSLSQPPAETSSQPPQGALSYISLLYPFPNCALLLIAVPFSTPTLLLRLPSMILVFHSRKKTVFRLSVTLSRSRD